MHQIWFYIVLYHVYVNGSYGDGFQFPVLVLNLLEIDGWLDVWCWEIVYGPWRSCVVDWMDSSDL